MSSEDPMSEGPDGLIGLDRDLNKAAQVVAESMCFFEDDNDQRSLTLFGTNYNFAGTQAAQNAMIDARFKMVRALVTFAYAERAKAAAKQLAAALLGDA